MIRYVLRRLGYSLFVLFGVSVIVWGLTFLTGDPAATLLPLDSTPEQIAQFRQQYGLDKPFAVQYASFLGNALHGNFGESIRHHEAAMPLVLERLPATLRLAGAGVAFALIFSIPLGVLAAVKRGTAVDGIARTIAVLGQSLPSFWLAVLLILLFAVRLRWLPSSGSDGLRALVLPGITVGAFSAATIARLLRSTLLDAFAEDYVRTARAKGLREALVVLRHACRNAWLPVITVIALQIGALLGGTIIAEVIFAYPGMGRLAYDAISSRDTPVIQCFVLVSALVVVVVNLLLDLAYVRLDPRVELA